MNLTTYKACLLACEESNVKMTSEILESFSITLEGKDLKGRIVMRYEKGEK